jgi:hypothetical protein
MTHVKLNRKAIEDVANIHDLKHKIAAIRRKVGDLSGVDVMFNMVLIATYVRHNVSAGGIILTSNTVEEDVWQGKVGFVLKCGPDAFKDDPDQGVFFNGQSAEEDDWVVFKIGDAWQLTVGDWPCRLVRDSSIKVKTRDPKIIDKD